MIKIVIIPIFGPKLSILRPLLNAILPVQNLDLIELNNNFLDQLDYLFNFDHPLHLINNFPRISN